MLNFAVVLVLTPLLLFVNTVLVLEVVVVVEIVATPAPSTIRVPFVTFAITGTAVTTGPVS